MGFINFIIIDYKLFCKIYVPFFKLDEAVGIRYKATAFVECWYITQRK